MTEFKKFDKDTILTDPCLPNVYRSLFKLAEEFAVLGRIGTAKTMISLLLSEYASDWQIHQIRFLKLAFSEVNEWPKEIPQQDRTVESVTPQLPLNLNNEGETAQDDATQLGVLLEHAKACDGSTGGAAMDRSSALADALALAIRLASENSSSIEDIEADAKVQEILGHITKRMHSNCAIGYLTERRGNWPLLATGALARKFPLNMDKVDALANEAIATFTQRFQNGRKPRAAENKSIKELLEELERNTKANGVSFYREIDQEIPESLFHPPATDEEILTLEHKFNITFPDDYKEFLKITNGYDGTWNGYYLDPPLYGTGDIDWATVYVDDLPVELHESPTGIMDLELPNGTTWPGYKKPLEIGSLDIMDVWFIPPHDTNKVINAYNEAMNNPDLSDEVKRSTRKLIAARYGSWEAFEKLEWVVMEMDTGEGVPFGSFTQFLKEKVRRSEMGVWEGQGEKTSGSFAYSCMENQV